MMTIFGRSAMKHEMIVLRSQLHNIYSYELSKRSLSCFDDKRWIHEDGVYSWAYGHCKVADHEIWGKRDINNTQVIAAINSRCAFVD